MPTESDAPVPATAREKTSGERHDVFVSYSSVDRRRAIEVARALEARGWSIWIDKWRLLGGQAYRKVIARAIEDSRAVVVLWSESSVESQWVSSEADRAGPKLVAARLDGVELLPPFDQAHTIDLRTWNGIDLKGGELEQLVKSVADKHGKPAPELSKAKLHSTRWLLLRAIAPIAIAAITSVVLLSLLAFRFTQLGVLGMSLAALAVVVFVLLAKAMGQIPTLLAAGQRLCERIPLLVLVISTCIACCFVAVVIQAPESYLFPRTVSLETGGDDPRTAVLTKGETRVRWLMFAPPWGRSFDARADAHADASGVAYPWRSPIFELGKDLQPRPIVLLRVHRDQLAYLRGARIEFLRDSAVIGSAMLTADTGSVLIGGDRDLQALASKWSEALPENEIARARALACWSNSKRVDWSAPPPIDAELEAHFTTRTETRLVSNKFRLTGVFTDVELRFK